MTTINTLFQSLRRLPLLLIAGLASAPLYDTVLHIGVAHADPAIPAAVAPAAATGIGAELMTLLAVIAVVLGGLGSILGGLSVALHAIAARTKTSVDDTLAAEVDAGHAKLDALLSFLRGLSIPTTASTTTLQDTSPDATTTITSPQTPSAKVAQAGRASLSMIAALTLGAAVLGAGIAITGCATLRSTASTGLNAFIDCEAPDVTKLLPDLLPLAQAEVAKWVGGAGAPIDTDGLKADVAGIKGDAARCALAAAIDALAAQSPAPPADPVAPVTARARIATDDEAAQLRASFSTVRAGLGWAPLHLAHGRVM
jgi:hypothetical protein